jgi:hypothetical protein
MSILFSAPTVNCLAPISSRSSPTADPRDSPAASDPRYIASRRTHRNHRLSTTVPLLGIVAETCLPSSCLLKGVSSSSTIPAFRRHVTIFCKPTHPRCNGIPKTGPCKGLNHKILSQKWLNDFHKKISIF